MIPCSSIRDRAITLETYARQAHNVEAERKACEIRLRAERKAGALSAKLERRRGKRTDTQPPALARRLAFWLKRSPPCQASMPPGRSTASILAPIASSLLKRL